MWLESGGSVIFVSPSAVRLFGAVDSAELISKWDQVGAGGLGVGSPVPATLRRLAGGEIEVVLTGWEPASGMRCFQAIATEDPGQRGSDWTGACPIDDDSPAELAEEIRRGLFSSRVDCVKILDRDGHLIYMNPGGRELMAVTDFSAIQGNQWIAFWEGPFRQEAESALRQAQEGGVGRFTGLCAKKNGQLRWWDVVVTPMSDASGTVRHILSVSRDVSDLKRLQMLDALERGILESIASSKPISEPLGAICNLAEVWANGVGTCSILTVDVSNEENLTVVSSPNAPQLVGLTLPKAEVLSGNLAALASVPQLSEYASFHACPLRGPEDVLLGVLAVWLKDSKQSAGIVGYMETSADLAAVALTREAQMRRIRYKQERLAAINKAAPIGLYQCDLAGNWIYVNERYTQLTGLALDQCGGEGWIESIHPDDRQTILNQWREARAAGIEFKAEYRLNRPGKGRARWVITQETPFGLDGHFGTIIDISEIKEAWEKIAEGAERFQTLANNISQLCWMAEPGGWISWYNDRWYEYTGTTFETMQGWGWTSVHHPDHIDRVVAKIDMHWKSGEVWEDTFPLRSKSGEYRWFLSRAIPIRDASGRVLRWFGTNTDVTEQRQLEAVMNRQNRALQRSNEDLSRFAFVAGHDLQEPLRMILSYAQLIQRTVAERLDEKTTSRIEAIVQSAERMGRLIKDLLTYAEASADSDEVLVPVDMNQVMEQAKELLKGRIEESGATVTSTELPVVRAHESQIVQVMQNLLSNSIKYRRPDVPPEITVDAQREGEFWRITIRDNGQGFEPEHATRIFDFLTRLHGRDVPGSGLGLGICKSILERFNGSIGAEGFPGRGSNFWFVLPAVTAEV